MSVIMGCLQPLFQRSGWRYPCIIAVLAGAKRMAPTLSVRMSEFNFWLRVEHSPWGELPRLLSS